MTAVTHPSAVGAPGLPPETRAARLASLGIAGVVLMSGNVLAPAAVALLPGFLVLLGFWLTGGFPWRRAAGLVWRLKWFYLSLLVFFGWLQGPSQPDVAWGAMLPSLPGLGEAAIRIAALALVVGWVAWFTTAFDRPAQIAGLLRWLNLLRPLGIRGERFARRLFLALDYFEHQHRHYREFRDRCSGTRWRRLMAGREFLVKGLDRALSGRPVSDAVAPAPAERAGGPDPAATRAGLAWQVSLLWVAGLSAIVIRSAAIGPLA
ncbi:hypothetical protein [Thioalkalivibrio paradoxus]|uniref:Cobalt transporter n=1 Tax=Thioalkalivibrio paradoxus ARh 1 TaxID=713585 RepID=W0DJ68_9GAMM|nr:hypothetical protein [Thioalkalivibrio paradoxus]AHE98649.1 hypothetical protein THITH_10775 [Thioalkalivibrio paradoxus ARh 1]